jgi:excisionase family DNA binding protein
MASTAMEPLTPTGQEAQLAAQAASRLKQGTLELSELPNIAILALSRVLNEFAKGHSLSVVHLETDLTTQEAAEYLNVSRPYFVKLLEQGQIGFHLVGNQKRVNLEDVVIYKKRQKEESYAALAELQALSQELRMDE